MMLDGIWASFLRLATISASFQGEIARQIQDDRHLS